VLSPSAKALGYFQPSLRDEQHVAVAVAIAIAIAIAVSVAVAVCPVGTFENSPAL
jgi:hypothetical protein